MKIGVYTICKNEKLNLDRWWASARMADVITVVDTGSTDGTLERLYHIQKESTAGHKLEIHRAHINPWRFDVGHNVALSLVPPDVDVCIPLAMDEAIFFIDKDSTGNPTQDGDWMDVFRTKSGGDKFPLGSAATKFTYLYEFAPTMAFNHDRIHTRHGFTWRYPFHEGIYPDGVDEERFHLEHLFIQQRQESKPDQRLIRDLELAYRALAEWPDDKRMAFYVGRQFMYARRPDEAIYHLNRYLTMKGPTHAWESAAVAEALMYAWRMKS